MAAPERTDIEIGGKPYNISTTSMPYFASYIDFQRRSGLAADKHGDIPLFDAAFQGVESGFRRFFRILGTDLTEYSTLCDTLDFLCIDTLGGRSIASISEDLKSGKGWYDDAYKPPLFVRGQKERARDSAFRLLYLLLKTDLEDETKTRQKMYEAVLFVVSHRGIFKYHARKTIRTAYEERFDVSEKQRKILDKWPVLVLEPGTDGMWSDDDVTTEDDPADELDSDDW